MNFKIFPAANKIPLIRGWQTEASSDPEVHRAWENLYRGKMTHWGMPTGLINGLLVLDVDVKGGGFETLKTLNPGPTLSQRTISNGLHLLYRYPQDGKRYGNRTKFMPGLDIRGEGGYIIYYGTDSKELADSPLWLNEQALKTIIETTPGATVKVAPEIAEGIILRSLESIREASPGESNNVLNTEAFRIGQLVISGAVTREYAEAALMRAAVERGKPQYEAQATIRSGLDGGSKKPITSPFGDQMPVASFQLPPPPTPTRWTPPQFSLEDLHNTSKLRKPQLFEHWSTEDIAITTADGGTGKTTMKLFEAICLALGYPFLGFNCLKPGKTLFITGEDTDKKLGAMLGQILRQMGFLENSLYNDKVQCVLDSILIKKDADLCLIVKDRSNFLQPNGDAMRKLTEAVDDIGPKMIVFDPISSFWGSEAALNDMAKAVTKFMSHLAEYSGASVEMINHMGKVSSSSKDMSQFAGRGGTGLPSNARVSRALRTVFDEEYQDLTGETLTDKQSAMLCNVNKFTDGSPLYNKPFIIVRDGYLFSRKTLTDAKIKEAERTLSDNERVFAFVKECRLDNKFPTKKVVFAHFMTNGDPLPKARVERSLELLEFRGHMGEKVKPVENPDQTVKDKVLVITDMEGKEN